MLEVKEKKHYLEEAEYYIHYDYCTQEFVEAKDQLQAYLKYLDEGEEVLSDDEKYKVKALELLEQLGYPMYKLGTYLYVTVIADIMKKLSYVGKDDLMKSGMRILNEINNPFSGFYVLLSREDLDLGVKSFHEYINCAVALIDKSRANGGLAYDIYNGLPDEISVSENALVLASYLTNKTAKKEAKMPYIKTIFERE